MLWKCYKEQLFVFEALWGLKRVAVVLNPLHCFSQTTLFLTLVKSVMLSGTFRPFNYTFNKSYWCRAEITVSAFARHASVWSLLGQVSMRWGWNGDFSTHACVWVCGRFSFVNSSPAQLHAECVTCCSWGFLLVPSFEVITALMWVKVVIQGRVCECVFKAGLQLSCCRC